MSTTDQLTAQLQTLTTRVNAIDGVGLPRGVQSDLAVLNATVAGLQTDLDQSLLVMQQQYTNLVAQVQKLQDLVNSKFGTSPSGQGVTDPWTFSTLGSVINAIGTPPASPKVGDAYLVQGFTSGAWIGYPNTIAVWSVSDSNPGWWAFHTPTEGWLVWNTTAELFYIFTEGTWITRLTVPNLRPIYNTTIVLSGSTLVNVGDQDTGESDLDVAFQGCACVCTYVDGSQIEPGVKLDARVDTDGHITLTRTALIANTITSTVGVNIRVIL